MDSNFSRCSWLRQVRASPGQVWMGQGREKDGYIAQLEEDSESPRKQLEQERESVHIKEEEGVSGDGRGDGGRREREMDQYTLRNHHVRR